MISPFVYAWRGRGSHEKGKGQGYGGVFRKGARVFRTGGEGIFKVVGTGYSEKGQGYSGQVGGI